MMIKVGEWRKLSPMEKYRLLFENANLEAFQRKNKKLTRRMSELSRKEI